MLGSQLKRRALLKRGLLGGTLLGLGGATWVGLRKTRLGPTPQRPLQVLTLQEYAIAAAIAGCLLPAAQHEGKTWPSAAQVQCPEKFDQLLVQLHPETVEELKQLLHLFENGLSGLLSGSRPTPFTWLDLSAQAARLEAWRHSSLTLLRSGYLALTRLFHATYYASPEVFALLGYPGPPEVPYMDDPQ